MSCKGMAFMANSPIAKDTYSFVLVTSPPEEVFYEEKYNDYKKGGQHIDGFAVFDFQNAKPRGGNECASHYAQFGA